MCNFSLECIVGSAFVLSPGIQQQAADEYICNGDVVVDATISERDGKGRSNVGAINGSASLVIACVCRQSWKWDDTSFVELLNRWSHYYLSCRCRAWTLNGG